VIINKESIISLKKSKTAESKVFVQNLNPLDNQFKTKERGQWENPTCSGIFCHVINALNQGSDGLLAADGPSVTLV
jgi:hypothetical protein